MKKNKIKEIYEYILDLLNMGDQLLYIAGNDKLPEPLSAEEEKELYLSTLFCCLENYKECDDFKGIVAGCN